MEEVFTGTKVYGRKVFAKLLGVVKEGDTIVFDEISRMSRNEEEGFSLYQELYEKGVNLVFLKEPLQVRINHNNFCNVPNLYFELLEHNLIYIYATCKCSTNRLAPVQIYI